jgi:hypothetical protein
MLPCVLLISALFLSACGAPTSTGPIGTPDPAVGEKLFKQPIIGSAPGCITCHSLKPGEAVVGPSLAGIAPLAGQRAAGKSAQEYLRQSILEPDAFLVPGYNPGSMFSQYKDRLTRSQVNDLVEYLLTLK